MKINIISIITILLMTTTIQAQYQPLYKVTPNQIKVANEEKEEQFEGITFVSKVTEPAFQYFRVKEDNIKRPCVIIYPGGGYTILASCLLYTSDAADE